MATTEPSVIGRDEAEEIQRAKQRDSSIWAAWHDAYYPVIYRYAYVRLSNAEDAEDLASQVFLEALKGIDRFKYQGKPVLAWFYGIASHLVSKRRRQLARSPVPLEEQVHEVAGDEEQSLVHMMVWSALEKLKDEHRDVLILRFLLDMPTARVAALMGKSEQATYSLQVRAIEAARRAFGSDESNRHGEGKRRAA